MAIWIYDSWSQTIKIFDLHNVSVNHKCSVFLMIIMVYSDNSTKSNAIFTKLNFFVIIKSYVPPTIWNFPLYSCR